MGFLANLFRKNQPAVTDWQAPIVQDICIGMMRQIPDDWNSACIVLLAREAGLGNGVGVSPITPEPCRDLTPPDDRFVAPDDSLLVATRRLEMGWVARGGTFHRAIISIAKDADGDWGIGCEYEHEM